MNSEHDSVRVPPPPHSSEQEIWRREYREAMEAEWRVERARLEAEKESALEAQRSPWHNSSRSVWSGGTPAPLPLGTPHWRRLARVALRR